ncbi:Major Facilitator Superfamily protein [Paenibacillus sp. UNCCL117]|uniref:MFS transporter n=1 Tax=unclassified Paenibacillus TaxID=185978 RepID=UPI000887D539|nr:MULTISPECIES: MFS transporter [unclassified Paenibacillus]SDD14814.1 Major Facilitator Superfamily protein [Paenibacillus sp. cl123]SFW34305.1 Major Facilitator Superfamily protein [Paenibacillus sp. UNCCL117]
MWSNRNVWIVLIGEFIAGLGLWMSIIANLEFMQQQVPSDFVKSLILFAGLVAGVAFGPLAGRVIDTVSKKKVLLYASGGRTLSVGIMFIALNQDSVFWMVVFFVALQASSAFYFPALQSVIPLIVPERDLLTLNGVHMNAGTLARILGTTLAGLLLAVMSLYGLYLLSIIAYALLFVSTFLLQVRETGELPKETDTVGTGKAKTAEAVPAEEAAAAYEAMPERGFKAILPVLRAHPAVVTVLLLTIVPTLFIGGFNLMVINISELQQSAGIKSWLYAVEGICIIATGFLIKRFAAGGQLMGRLFLFASFVGAAQALLFFAQIPALSLIAFGVFGVSVGGFFPAAATLFQHHIPKAYHGRFFSFRSMLDRVMFQIVLLSTGLLLDTIGLQWMVLVYGIGSLALVGWLALRESRRRLQEGGRIDEAGRA